MKNRSTYVLEAMGDISETIGGLEYIAKNHLNKSDGKRVMSRVGNLNKVNSKLRKIYTELQQEETLHE